MTIFPFAIREEMNIYTRVSKLKPGTILKAENRDPKDVDYLWTYTKKQQILEQARTEVLEHILKMK